SANESRTRESSPALVSCRRGAPVIACKAAAGFHHPPAAAAAVSIPSVRKTHPADGRWVGPPVAEQGYLKLMNSSPYPRTLSLTQSLVFCNMLGLSAVT